MDTAGLPRRRSPGRFIALVFGLAVPFWALGAVVQTPSGAPVRLPLSALQLVTPLMAAAILIYREEGRRGVRRHLQRLVDAGRAASWTKYLVIMVLMPMIYASAYLAMRAAGRQLPETRVTAEGIALVTAVFFVAAIFEEGGWTAYALDPLQDRWGMVRAALALGLVWASFHLVADLQGGHQASWILWHRAGSIGLRMLLVVAYNATGRGVLAAVLMHTMDNVSWQLFPNGGTDYDPSFVAPLIGVAAAAGVAWTRRTPISPRSGSARPGSR